MRVERTTGRWGRAGSGEADEGGWDGRGEADEGISTEYGGVSRRGWDGR